MAAMAGESERMAEELGKVLVVLQAVQKEWEAEARRAAWATFEAMDPKTDRERIREALEASGQAGRAVREERAEAIAYTECAEAWMKWALKWTLMSVAMSGGAADRVAKASQRGDLMLDRTWWNTTTKMMELCAADISRQLERAVSQTEKAAEQGEWAEMWLKKAIIWTETTLAQVNRAEALAAERVKLLERLE